MTREMWRLFGEDLQMMCDGQEGQLVFRHDSTKVQVAIYNTTQKGLYCMTIIPHIANGLVNPRRACAARVTVVVLCVCVCVCVCVSAALAATVSVYTCDQ